MTDMTAALVPIMTIKDTVTSSDPRQNMSTRADMLLQEGKILKELEEVATLRLEISQANGQLQQKEAHMASLELGAKEKEDFTFQKFREAAKIMRASEECYRKCRVVREGYTDKRAGINREIGQGQKQESEAQDRSRRLQEESKRLDREMLSIAIQKPRPWVDAELELRLKADGTLANSLSILDPSSPEYSARIEILRFIIIMEDVAGTPATATGRKKDPNREIADSQGPLHVDNNVGTQLEPSADQGALENPPPPLIDGGDRTTVLVTMQEAPTSRPSSVCDNVNMESVNDLQFISSSHSTGHHPGGPIQTARRGRPLLKRNADNPQQQSYSAKKRRNDS